MTTLTLETILDSEFNNQPATKADLRNMGMHFESKFAMVDARFAQVDARFTELDTKIDRKFAEADTKIEIRFKSVERNARINYVLSGIIALCSLIGALGVFLK